MKQITYKIIYHYGIHHIWIETDEKSFFNVINDMNEEFTMYKDETNNNITEYFIINYYGDPDTIGKIETIETEKTK